MSRIADSPISIPSGVEVQLGKAELSVKGPKGQLTLNPHTLVQVVQEDAVLKVVTTDESKQANALAGTTRALVNNMVIGVSQGFERKLTIVGVGYRAQAQGSKLNMSLGFSHPVVYEAPKGITLETPSQTEILVRGTDKQLVGQAAAEIRAFRPPEPYKGKGVRYANEYVARKQAKKK
ncbi:MAG: 50S ribosomal protein L6 [Gammaproteobacteria bacterium]|nr:50S ribosomal protein L6 [Gammaproteobacteria bacterium]